MAVTEYGGETLGGARLQTCRVAIGGDMSWRHGHKPHVGAKPAIPGPVGGTRCEVIPATHEFYE